MTIYYIYVKTHTKTGLKYLGFTTKSDPHKYKGSGEYWLPHLRIHGNDYSTEIIRECKTIVEVSEWGLYYSDLWDIVKSKDASGKKIWANLKPESGNGAASGRDNPMHKPLIKARHNIAINDPVVKARHRIATTIAMNTASTQEKLRKSRNTPEYKQRLSQTLHHPDVIAARKGRGNSHYDHTIYVFQHSTTGRTEECTRHDLMIKYGLDQGNLAHLINGRCNIIKGWKIKNNN
jgi:hypothetical protein